VGVARSLSLERLPEAARPVLEALVALLGPRRQGWLAGGALRDALLGEPVEDLDVAVERGATALGRALADHLGAAFVVLDERRGACRVIPRTEPGIPTDLTDLRASTLPGDLRSRDFTVNALAASVREMLARGSAPVEDATGGLDDLEARLVRPCAPSALEDDAVRTLRAARLAIRPGWRLDAGLEPGIRRAVPRLVEASAERVRDELVAILGDPAAARGLRLLDGWSVLAVLLPESGPMRDTPQPAPHCFDVWEHSLRAVEAVDALLPHLGALGPGEPALRAHLAEPLGDRATRRETLRLAALLHDLAKPETRTLEGGRIRFIGHAAVGARRAGEVARRWRLSGQAAAVLERLVAHHLRPMHLAQSGPLSRRAGYRFFRDLGPEAQDLLLLALADTAALDGRPPLAVWNGPGGSVLRALMAGMEAEQRAAEAPPLLRGEDVMAAFGLAPGPAVGRLLALAREAQVLGLVSTREEALDHLRRAGERLLDTLGQDP
jgi:putative nucleotidyltransferase with HDIG domain